MLYRQTVGLTVALGPESLGPGLPLWAGRQDLVTSDRDGQGKNK